MKLMRFATLFAGSICISALLSASALAETVSVFGSSGSNGTIDQFGNGTNGTDGGAADAAAGPNGDSTNTATATGGSGGAGGSPFNQSGTNRPGAGGNGGAATATAVTITGAPDGSAIADAFGGNGGNSGVVYLGPGPNHVIENFGAKGGDATATAVTLIPNGSATATASASGGHGGDGIIGVGGSATAQALASTGSASPVQSTASVQGGNAGDSSGSGVSGVSLSGGATAYGESQGGPVTASASVRGGNGGSSDLWPSYQGGNGGSASIVNGVSGSTTGPLTLSQTAIGGNGAPSVPLSAGAGGSATSSLSYVDGAASSLTGSSSAIGGSGFARFPIAGSAKATISLTSTRPSTNVTSTAVASTGSFSSTSATAAATAVGSGIARADAIAGPMSAFPFTGGASATSQSNVGDGQYVSTTASTPTATSSGRVPQLEAVTQSVMGGSGLSNTGITVGQVNSTVTGLPTSPSLSPKVAAAFASGGTVFAIGSMNSGAIGGNSLTNQIRADFQFNYAPNTLLVLGLMDDLSVGTGFQTSSLDVYLNSSLLHDYQFPDLASAQKFFSDNVIKLEDWPGGLAELSMVYSLTSDPLNDSGVGFDYAVGTANTPVPAALPLFATALGGLGLVGWRRKRKARASSLSAA